MRVIVNNSTYSTSSCEQLTNMVGNTRHLLHLRNFYLQALEKYLNFKKNSQQRNMGRGQCKMISKFCYWPKYLQNFINLYSNTCHTPYIPKHIQKLCLWIISCDTFKPYRELDKSIIYVHHSVGTCLHWSSSEPSFLPPIRKFPLKLPQQEQFVSMFCLVYLFC